MFLKNVERFLWRSRGFVCSNYSKIPDSRLNSLRKCDEKITEVDLNRLFGSCVDVHHARCLHAILVAGGKEQSPFISSRLVKLYADVCSVHSARLVFDSLSKKDMYTWNSMISAYVRHGYLRDGLDCFQRLISGRKHRPDFYSFPPILKACTHLIDGEKIHCWVMKVGFEWDLFVTASLIHMYCRFGNAGIARRLFDRMSHRDLGCWNAMISGYCQSGHEEEAVQTVEEMIRIQLRIDPVTISTALSACAQTNDLSNGIKIQIYVIKTGFQLDIFVSNSLINAHSKFGNLEYARKTFHQMTSRDTVSWNSIISAHEQNGDDKKTLDFFILMKKSGFHPDKLTLLTLASVFSKSGDRRNCAALHGAVAKSGILLAGDDAVLGNALIDAYSKIGEMDRARKLFDLIRNKDAVTFNTMIKSYAQSGMPVEAVGTFRSMKAEMRPNQGTWVAIVPVYSMLGSLRMGETVHGVVFRTGLVDDLFLSTCLLDMYGKCGRLDMAVKLFDEMPQRDFTAVPWNAVMSSLGMHGCGADALRLFDEMLERDVMPDGATFVSLLSACSHSGLAGEGEELFGRMESEFGIVPGLKHYGCVVDLMGRSGDLVRAREFIGSMPVRPDASVWGALLASCRVHGDVWTGRFAASRLFESGTDDAGYHVVLSNALARHGRWDGAVGARSAARAMGLRKTPGWSSIRVAGEVSVFYSGGRSHPSSELLYREASDLTLRMKAAGYVPDLSFVLHDVEDDEKEAVLAGHSERLAIVFGITATPAKTAIHVFKNLRICGDCHNAVKFISSLTEREIVVRDSNRFHHFKDGLCSCSDYW